MDKVYQIIVLNPGSTSTKIAVFQNEICTFQVNITHTAEELAGFPEIPDQLAYRKEMILEKLAEQKIPIQETAAFAAICTGLPPMEGGTFLVNQLMV